MIKKVKKTDYIAVSDRHCKACWECFEACPKQVFTKINVLWGFHKHIKISNPEACIGCLKCVNACQHEAITVVNA